MSGRGWKRSGGKREGWIGLDWVREVEVGPKGRGVAEGKKREGMSMKDQGVTGGWENRVRELVQRWSGLLSMFCSNFEKTR